jgi:hypothetical protein
LFDQVRTDAVALDDNNEDAWMKDFMARLAGTLRDIGNRAP